MSDLLVNIRIRAFESVTQVARKVKGELDKIAQLSKDTAEKLKGTADLQQAAEGIGKLGDALRGAGAAIRGPLIAGAEAVDDLEDSIGMAGLRAGASSDQINSMVEKASLLGRTTSVSAEEIAKGFQTLGESGLSAAEQLSAIEPTLKLASAAGIDMGSAGQLAGDLLKKFGLDASQLPSLLDTVTGTAQNAHVSLSDMAMTLAQAAPNAKRFGVGIDEVAGLAAALGQTGVRGQEAGSTISTIITQLGAAKKLGAKGLNLLGISTVDKETGKLKSIPTLFGEIAKATSGMGDARKEKFMQAIFGPQAAQSVARLMSSLKGGELQAFAAQAGQAGGALDKVFGGSEKAQETERLDNAVGGLTKAIGKPFAEPLEKLKNLIADMINGIVGWTERHPTLTKVILYAAAGISILLTVAGALAALLSGALLVAITALSAGPILGLIGGFSGLASVIGGVLIAPFTALIGLLGTAATSMWAVLAPALLVAAPFIAIAAAVAAVGLAIQQLIKHWDELSLSEGWKGIKEAFGTDGVLSTVGQMFDPRTVLRDIGVMGPATPEPTIGAAAAAAGGQGALDVNIKLDQDGRAQLQSVSSSGDVGLDVDAGLATVGG